MNKIYKIRPKRIDGFQRVPQELQVIFQWQKMRLGENQTQIVTTCLLRDGLKVVGEGYSFENPNDERDENNLLGMQHSFKRSVISMLKKLNYKKTYSDCWKREKELVSAFRLALWNARRK